MADNNDCGMTLTSIVADGMTLYVLNGIRFVVIEKDEIELSITVENQKAFQATKLCFNEVYHSKSHLSRQIKMYSRHSKKSGIQHSYIEDIERV